MSDFTVYANPDLKSQGHIPFLLDIQNELLSPLETRVVVPLYRESSAKTHPISRLTPVVTFQGLSLVAMVPELAGISKRHLGAIAGDLSEVRPALLAAIDLLLTGSGVRGTFPYPMLHRVSLVAGLRHSIDG